MLNIKKKIIAIAVICAMALSMAACSDKKDGNNTVANKDIQTATLSSEEADKLREVDLEISEYIPPSDAQQDPVEQGGDSSANAGSNSDSAANADNNQNADSAIDQSSFDAEQMMQETDMVITPAGDADKSESSNSDGNSNNNSNSDSQNPNQNQNQNSHGQDNNDQNNNDSSDAIKGKKKIQQAFWMNLAGNYVFDGEFITATFKIKDTTADGTYPITVDWLDFSNIDAVTVKANGINGSVVVGGDATANTFKNDGSFEVMADNVSGKPGDTVTVTFRFNKNPGICASVFRFGYDSDALEYVSGGKGADFVNALSTQNKE